MLSNVVCTDCFELRYAPFAPVTFKLRSCLFLASEHAYLLYARGRGGEAAAGLSC